MPSDPRPPELQGQSNADLKEAVRAPLGNLANAAQLVAARANDYEWALWATDPREDHGQNFNDEYAERSLAEAEPAFREALDELVTSLETDGDRIRSLFHGS